MILLYDEILYFNRDFTAAGIFGIRECSWTLLQSPVSSIFEFLNGSINIVSILDSRLLSRYLRKISHCTLKKILSWKSCMSFEWNDFFVCTTSSVSRCSFQCSIHQRTCFHYKWDECSTEPITANCSLPSTNDASRLPLQFNVQLIHVLDLVYLLGVLSSLTLAWAYPSSLR